jgi:hypothetical protein
MDPLADGVLPIGLDDEEHPDVNVVLDPLRRSLEP